MEITDVDTYALQLPIGRTVGDSRLSITDTFWVIVELTTDTGITGTGWMGSLGFGEDMMARFVDSQFADILRGRNPWEIEAIREDMRAQTIYYGEQGISAWPRAAIDVALWDIKATLAGQPLYRYLGGSDATVPTYASNMDSVHPNETLESILEAQVEEGFTAFKTKVGNKSLEKEIERLELVREIIGPSAELFIDANQAWTVAEAIKIIRALEKFDIGWVEEPISEYDLSGHRRLADRIEPPIATGEMFYRPERFHYLFENDSIGVAQPDLIRSGGVTGQVDITRMAAARNVPVASHFYYAISGHVVSAAPTGWIVEYIPEYDIAPILDEPPVVEDGTLHLPDRPGHGYTIDENARSEYEVTFD